MSHFNHEANNWDSPQKIKLMGVLASKTNEILNIDKKIDVLDFGCGTGLFGMEFLDHSNSLLGIDTSEGMLEVFDTKAKGMDHVQSMNVNLEKENVDVIENKFDLIVSSMTFHHLDRPKEILEKLSSLLKEDGQMAIVDLEKEDGSFHPDPKGMGVKHFGFSNEELQAWGNDLGLSVKIQRINSLEKNEKEYAQFLAIYSKDQ